jgi:transposase
MHGPFNYRYIIAIDLGKFNSMVCLYDPATHTHRFVAVQTIPSAIHDLLTAHAGEDPADTLVVIETCDVCGWVHDIAKGLGMAVAVANVANDAWRWKKVKRKTDKDDALKLATMALLGQLPTVHVPPPAVRQRRRLIRHRKTLVERRTISKNQIRSIYSQQGLQLPKGNTLWTKAGVTQLRSEARPIVDCAVDDLWRGRLNVELDLLEAIEGQLLVMEKKLDELGEADPQVQRLQSIKGVGPRLAETVVAHLDDAHRFRNSRTLGAYGGLVPKKLASGQMKRVGRITRRGSTLLRGMLVEVAWMVYRHNAWAKAFVLKVSRGMKSRKRIAIVALARKLLVKMWAMLRDGTTWQEPGCGGERGKRRRNQCEDLAALGRVSGSPPEDTGREQTLSSVVGGLGV